MPSAHIIDVQVTFHPDYPGIAAAVFALGLAFIVVALLLRRRQALFV